MRRPDHGVELLERALAYTRGTLQHVRPHHLHHPTPCARWDLDRLLDHLGDALDAFTEGADGVIGPELPAHRPLDVRVTTLQLKAGRVLGAWAAPGRPDVVRVGGALVRTDVVQRVAALEIATHGWDVGCAVDHVTPLPDGLARELYVVAHALVDDDERGVRFAPPLAPASGAGAGERLLAFLGREPGP